MSADSAVPVNYKKWTTADVVDFMVAIDPSDPSKYEKYRRDIWDYLSSKRIDGRNIEKHSDIGDLQAAGIMSLVDRRAINKGLKAVIASLWSNTSYQLMINITIY